ncbi:GYD domain-containing protein [Candidatus Methylacidithermus pantelleriae]|uniref:GYD family protein n=1 Tax=Candidatus Methylacidithermus pantelleriae TaxID=2744239 RepID=A0A8J2BLG7_9BACT|nr:GYD domain-containing protein [Candidatus Methylacidithermus pantelleriae]CAF0699096.1 GYD family protein [Candidatus Methylacidithermus pantelleriae]
MATYIILSTLSPQAFEDPKQFKEVAQKVTEKIRQECPGVTWKESYVTLGRYDIVDIVESDDPVQVERAALIIRGYGRAQTETLPARPWSQFLQSL